MRRIALFSFAAVISVCLSATAQEAELPSTPQEVTKLLEKRWPLKAIEEFCTPERRRNPLNQNLVPDGDKFWKGKLYEGKPVPFDSIEWYAGVDKKKIEYSLNARRGKDDWILEIGDEKTLRQPLKMGIER